MGWFVYVLLCKTGELYTGCTNDVSKRLEAHNKGVASKYTRSRIPVTLIYRERCADRSSALRREAQIKGMRRGAKLALIWSGRRRNV